MKYKILDKVNNEYLDLTKYCVNGFGDIMTVGGLVIMNQDDFKVEYEIIDNIKTYLNNINFNRTPSIAETNLELLKTYVKSK